MQKTGNLDHYKAKDVLRASGLPLLAGNDKCASRNNLRGDLARRALSAQVARMAQAAASTGYSETAPKHVASDLDKVKSGRKLSPVLLVPGRPLLVADGYHRVCASYHLDENADIPCRIVDALRS